MQPIEFKICDYAEYVQAIEKYNYSAVRVKVVN